jgi:hypothetical protein
MATTTATEAVTLEPVLEDAPTLVAQFRKFLWLASGLFSTSSLALAFGDFFAAGSIEAASTHFLAALAAAGLFGIATLLKLGPDEA